MKQVLLGTLGMISILFGNANAGVAASITKTEFSMSFDTSPSSIGEPKGICSYLGICQPNIDSVVPDINPQVETPPEPYVNDTGFAILGVIAKLPENRTDGPAVFIGGSSDIFNNINISDDGQKLSFTEGVIAVNEVIIADFETEPESDSTLTLTLTPVPEPPSLIGILACASLGTSMWFQRKRSKSKSALLNLE